MIRLAAVVAYLAGAAAVVWVCVAAYVVVAAQFRGVGL